MVIKKNTEEMINLGMRSRGVRSKSNSIPGGFKETGGKTNIPSATYNSENWMRLGKKKKIPPKLLKL